MEKAAATLTPDEWQNHGTKKSVIHENKSGETVTRLVDEACIFLNKPGFAGGVGCAFHIAAMNRGVDHMTLKPEVCWQLPLRREDQVDDEEGHVTSVIRQWDRRHWGKGGREFHWWCTESPDAFVGTKPVYEEMQAELTKMVGAKAYEQFVALVEGAGPAAEPRCGAPPSGGANPGDRFGSRGGRRRECGQVGARARRRPRLARLARLVRLVLRGPSPSGGRRPHRTAPAWNRGSGRTCPLRPGTTTRERHRVQPRIRRTALWTHSKTVSGCAPLRSADGVPFSRELLVTPGPHLRVPPPAAKPHRPFDRCPIVVATSGASARDQVREPIPRPVCPRRRGCR